VDNGPDTLWAVVLGAVLATLGGFVATRLEAFFRRRERERAAALLFGELLSVVALITSLADASRGRGEPYGPLTMRMLRAIRRETEIYDRNRESLYDLRDGAIRARIHTLMSQLAMTLQGVIDADEQLGQTEDAVRGRPEDDPVRVELAARCVRLVEQRQQAFDFMVGLAGTVGPVTVTLRELARQPFGDHAAMVRDS
jgi:uncharacterized membrane protein YccC